MPSSKKQIKELQSGDITKWYVILDIHHTSVNGVDDHSYGTIIMRQHDDEEFFSLYGPGKIAHRIWDFPEHEVEVFDREEAEGI